MIYVVILLWRFSHLCALAGYYGHPVGETILSIILSEGEDVDHILIIIFLFWHYGGHDSYRYVSICCRFVIIVIGCLHFCCYTHWWDGLDIILFHSDVLTTVMDTILTDACHFVTN